MYEVLNYFLLNLCHRFKKVVQAHYCRLLNNRFWRISTKCNDSRCEWAFWASVWDQALWRAVTICKHLWCKRIVLWIRWDATLALTLWEFLPAGHFTVILLEWKHLGTTVTQPQSRGPAKITERVQQGALGVSRKGFQALHRTSPSPSKSVGLSGGTEWWGNNSTGLLFRVWSWALISCEGQC